MYARLPVDQNPRGHLVDGDAAAPRKVEHLEVKGEIVDRTRGEELAGHIAPKAFEAALAVAHMQREHGVDDRRKGVAHQPAKRRVIAVGLTFELARADKNPASTLAHDMKRRADELHAVGEIRIGEDDDVAPRRGNAPAHRTALAGVFLIGDDSGAGGLRRLKRRECAVGAAVVDHDQLVVDAEPAQIAVGLRHGLRRALFFVVHGNHKRHHGKPPPHTDARAGRGSPAAAGKSELVRSLCERPEMF